MRQIILIAMLVLVGAIFLIGCDNPNWHSNNCNCYDCDDYYYDDYCAPPTPYGVYSVTGDECVRVYWNPVYAYDLDGYRVWRGCSETGYYYLIAETPSAYFVDWDVNNGQTYYYAISAYDVYGNESYLSDEIVFDTPRPEGYGERVYIVEEFPDDAGYDFSEYWVVPYDYPSADVFFGYDDETGHYYMQAANSSTDILIYGYTDMLSDVDWAPEDGWMSGGSVNLYEDYSYLIWTSDNHFAHIRITQIGYDYILFDWAYQTDYGNPELIVDGNHNNRFKYSGEKIGKKITMEIEKNDNNRI
ncbi:hypothetical protein J7L68_05925 [bacterium]|nr:hypothetical protein [bacterium]